MAMLAQQMQLANAMMPGAPLQPVVRAPLGLGLGAGSTAFQPGETPHSAGTGQEPAVLKWPSVCLCGA